MLARWIRALSMLGSAGWLAGCGGGVDEPPPDVAAPTITVQPVSQRVMASGAAGFDVTTSGSASTYQWQLCTDANPTCVTWSDIATAVSASYSSRFPSGRMVTDSPFDTRAMSSEQRPENMPLTGRCRGSP